MLENLAARMQQQIEAISLCLDHKLPHAALILLYTSIDILGWIGAETETAAVKDRFVGWAERYMLADSGLPCTGLDLYGARCGLLHRMSWESDLSARGLAREVYYVWGSAPLQVLHGVLESQTSKERVVGVRIEDLVRAFHVGIRRFVDDLEGKPDRAIVAAARGAKIFEHVPH